MTSSFDLTYTLSAEVSPIKASLAIKKNLHSRSSSRKFEELAFGVTHLDLPVFVRVVEFYLLVTKAVDLQSTGQPNHIRSCCGIKV